VNAKKIKKNARSISSSDMTMASKLRARRLELGMPQVELGDKAGVSYKQIQKYEKGINRVSADRLQKIAKALDMDVNDFFAKPSPAIKSVEPSDEFSLRLLRAYSHIKDQATRRQVVILIETIAATDEALD
jgi:transcriptional regulator with XRE-family HTH domain